MPRATVTFDDGSTGTYNVPANATPEELARARRRALGIDYGRPALIDRPSVLVTRPEEFEQEVDPSTGQIIGGLGVEASIGIGSQVLGAMTGPFYFPITFLGGAAGSIASQKIEGRDWDDIHWGRVVSAGVLTMVPGSSVAKGASGFARIAKPLAIEAMRGAGYGATDATIRAYIDEGRAPTGKELLTYGTIGAGFGTALKGAGLALSRRQPFTGESIDDIELVAGRVHNFKDRPFPEKNELIKNLGLKSNEGKREGLVKDDVIALGQWTKADVVEADKIIGKFKNSLEGEAKDISIMEGAFASANPMDPKAIKRKERALTSIENLYGTSFPSMFLTPRLIFQIQNVRNKLTIAEGISNKYRFEVNKELKRNPDSTIGADSFDYLSGKINVITPAMKKVESYVQELRKINVAFQETIFPFLSPNFSKKITSKQEKFLENFRKPWYHQTHKFFDDPSYTPEDKDRINLIKFLGSEAGEGEGFYFTIIPKGKGKNRRKVRSDNKRKLPDWAKDSDGKPLEPGPLREARNKEIALHIGRYDFNSASNKKKLSIHKFRSDPRWMNEEDILKFKREDWPKEYADFFGGALEIEVKGGGKRPDYGGIIEVGTSQLARKAINDELDFVVGNALIQSGLVRSIRVDPRMKKAQALFKEGTKEAEQNALALGISSPSEGGRGLAKMKLFSGRLEIETSPEILEALESIRFDTLVDDASNISSNTILNHAMKAYHIAIFTTKWGLVGLNLASYSTNTIGAIMATVQAGNNPFRNMIKGFRLALSEFGTIKNKPELMKDLVDAQQRGILDGSVKAEGVYASLRGHPGWHQKAMEMPSIKGPRTIYASIDNAWRYVNYKGHASFLDDIIPRSSFLSNKKRTEMVNDMAGIITNRTYPTYRGVNPQFKKLSKLGVLPVFVTFNAEIIRTMTNSATMGWKMIRKPAEFLVEAGMDHRLVPELGEGALRMVRLRGAKALGSLVAVSAGITAMAKGFNNLKTGMTNETRELMKPFIAPWSRDKTQIYIPDEDDPTKGKHINLSYLNPYSIAPRIIGAASKGVVTGDYSEITNVFLEEFAGEGNFIVKNAMLAIGGRDIRGEFISGSAEDAKQMRDKWKFFIEEAFKPVLYDDVVNILQIAGVTEGIPKRTGSELVARYFGLRMQDYDLKKSLMYTSNEMGQIMNQNRRALSTMIHQEAERGGAGVDPMRYGEEAAAAEELKYSPAFIKEYNDVNNNYRGIMNKLVKMASAAKELAPGDAEDGFIDDKVIADIFKSSRINTSDVIDILNDDIGNFNMVISPSPADLWDEAKKELIQTGTKNPTIPAILRKAREHNEGDPQTLRSLYSYARKTSTQSFKDLDTNEQLLTGLSGPQLFEQLYKLYPNIRGNMRLKKDLFRQGILNKSQFYFIDQYVPQTGNRSQKVNPFN